MPGMGINQPELPLVDATVFCTKTAAAQRLGVDVVTVARMLKDGRLQSYSPRGGKGERVPVLLSCAEVDRFRAARRMVRGR